MIYKIDGNIFSNLEGFWNEAEFIFADFIIEVGAFGKNFDAFRDILCVAPKETIVIWKNSKVSLQELGYIETKRQLELDLVNCQCSWTEIIKKKIELAILNSLFSKFSNIQVWQHRRKHARKQVCQTIAVIQLKHPRLSCGFPPLVLTILLRNLKNGLLNQGETIFDNLVKIFVEEANIQLRLE